MTPHVCSIVPPYLLSALAESDDPALRESARKTLAVSQGLHSDRKNHFAAKLAQSHHGGDHPGGPTPQRIVPDYLLEHISRAEGIDDSVKDSAAKTIALSQQIRDDRAAGKATDESAARAAIPQQFWRGVYDLEGRGSDQTNAKWEASLKLLPGKAVRLEGQPAVKDKAVNEAYDNCLKVLDFYKKVFNYTSIDNHNMHAISSVHFSQHYANAMWTSEKNQMIYGDGNTVLYNFTSSIDVIGHEMTVSSPCLR
jgi:Thermolysin metallopeptidase, catalytic domain